jgi:predicted transcriptional regulator of viral defense system
LNVERWELNVISGFTWELSVITLSSFSPPSGETARVLGLGERHLNFVYEKRRYCYLLYMNFEELVKLTGELPCFDLPLVVQATDDSRESVRVQLSRWMAQGRVIGLRRGVYTLSETYRRAPMIPVALARHLYTPSYLSGLWALGYYDLIPERVVWLTSVTPRVPRRFENPFGVFDYQNIKQEAFFGYRTATQSGAEMLVAEPEKALLDHWHLTAGEWTADRLAEMRYQNSHGIDAARLQTYAVRFRSPRLVRTVRRWLSLAAIADEGTVTL